MTLPLPPLPECAPGEISAYSDSDMQRYARAAQRIALEAAAKECEEHDSLDTSGYDTAHTAAAAIRVLSKELE